MSPIGVLTVTLFVGTVYCKCVKKKKKIKSLRFQCLRKKNKFVVKFACGGKKTTEMSNHLKDKIQYIFAAFSHYSCF